MASATADPRLVHARKCAFGDHIATDPFVHTGCVTSPNFCRSCLEIESKPLCKSCGVILSSENVEQAPAWFVESTSNLQGDCSRCKKMNIRYADFSKHARSECIKVHSCKYKSQGCVERFDKRTDRVFHELECVYTSLFCIGRRYGCTIQVARTNLAKHMKTCNAAFRVKYEEHMLSCPLAARKNTFAQQQQPVVRIPLLTNTHGRNNMMMLSCTYTTSGEQSYRQGLSTHTSSNLDVRPRIPAASLSSSIPVLDSMAVLSSRLGDAARAVPVENMSDQKRPKQSNTDISNTPQPVDNDAHICSSTVQATIIGDDAGFTLTTSAPAAAAATGFPTEKDVGCKKMVRKAVSDQELTGETPSKRARIDLSRAAKTDGVCVSSPPVTRDDETDSDLESCETGQR